MVNTTFENFQMTNIKSESLCFQKNNNLVIGCVLCLLFVGGSCDEFWECPTISEGYPPDCMCRYGPDYDNTTNVCPNPECPTASTPESTYPDCTCIEKNFAYISYTNDCFQVCPENSTGYWPSCKCDDEYAGFDKSALFKFKS